MISVDTNVIVRLLAADDQVQLKKARCLFEQEEIFITTSVVLECEWVLRYAYHFDPPAIVRAFQALFGLPNVTLEEHVVVSDALEWHGQGMDFADALHLAKSQQCASLVTFDRKFIKSAAKVTQFDVNEP